ncbi:MAG: TVP38/TMEM64 family protein [Clostridia bacterium]|nr:TVP38/TMEM64 family protein [Clostridia bacterium]
MKDGKTRSKVLNVAALICFLFALTLVVILRLAQQEGFVKWYHNYTDTLAHFETWMQTNGATWYSVMLILLNFVLKAVIPWFPLACICVASGVVFEWYLAIPINVIGLTLLFTIKYLWGKRYGGGNAKKILARYKGASEFIDSNQVGSAVVLFVLRLVPMMPINSVSQLYGTTDIPFWKYLIVSLVGFSYKLFSYTLIGRNVYDPMSARFLLPFVFLSLFSGFVILALNGVIQVSQDRLLMRPFGVGKKDKNNSAEEATKFLENTDNSAKGSTKE